MVPFEKLKTFLLMQKENKQNSIYINYVDMNIYAESEPETKVSGRAVYNPAIKHVDFVPDPARDWRNKVVCRTQHVLSTLRRDGMVRTTIISDAMGNPSVWGELYEELEQHRKAVDAYGKNLLRNLSKNNNSTNQKSRA